MADDSEAHFPVGGIGIGAEITNLAHPFVATRDTLPHDEAELIASSSHEQRVSQLSEVISERNDLKEKNRKLTAKNNDLESKIQNLERQLNKERGDHAETKQLMEDQLKHADSEKVELQQSVASLQQEVDELRRENVELQKKNDYLTKALIDLKEEFEAKIGEVRYDSPALRMWNASEFAFDTATHVLVNVLPELPWSNYENAIRIQVLCILLDISFRMRRSNYDLSCLRQVASQTVDDSGIQPVDERTKHLLRWFIVNAEPKVQVHLINNLFELLESTKDIKSKPEINLYHALINVHQAGLIDCQRFQDANFGGAYDQLCCSEKTLGTARGLKVCRSAKKRVIQLMQAA